MATMIPTEKRFTAEEYGRLPDNGKRTELVRGRIVEMNIPYPRHGQICGKVLRFGFQYLDGHDHGHLVCNDAGVQPQHDPDTLRGAEVAFFSYQRVPRGPFPRGYLAVVPELVFEVRSPTDRWSRFMIKVGEYIEAGVTQVCVLDEQTQTARIYAAHEPERVVAADEELTFPEILPGFSVRVARFFE